MWFRSTCSCSSIRLCAEPLPGLPPGWTTLTLIGFAAIVFLTTQLKCWGGGIGFPGAEVTGASECLNGSLVYLPALLVMKIVGGLLAERKHPAAPYVLWAALIFAISVTFRSLDLALCDAYRFETGSRCFSCSGRASRLDAQTEGRHSRCRKAASCRETKRERNREGEDRAVTNPRS
jgi:hypothetical protein